MKTTAINLVGSHFYESSHFYEIQLISLLKIYIMTYIDPKDLTPSYYSFEAYNTKHRMLTYWYQISEVLKAKPTSALEVGIGTGVVTSYLKHVGVKLTTADINEALAPDVCTSVLELKDNPQISTFDVVMCFRVLHHVPFKYFSVALDNMSKVSKEYVILTLPVDEVRLYGMYRYTSSSIFSLSLRLPLFFKNIVRKGGVRKNIGSGLWQIDSTKETSRKKVEETISHRFEMVKSYRLPEDSSHRMYVLRKK